jgi:hypothetical protein
MELECFETLGPRPYEQPPVACIDSEVVCEVEDWTNALQTELESMIQRGCDPTYRVTPVGLLARQPHVTPFMRAILLDWIAEISNEFTLKRETYHLAINFVDRYLQSGPVVHKSEFQLIGLGAMQFAAKLEEIYAPGTSAFAKAAANGYTKSEILQ